MSSPERKKRKKEWSPTLQSSPILSLPYDLLLSCVARVSRLYYPTLSLVSKSFRSLIASPELYKARSELGHTESCLYVGIQPIGDPGLSWYTLCKRPSGYVLATVSIPDYPRADFPGLVAVGSDIYNIGGSDLQSMSKGNYFRVTILDCRSHTWREAPSLRVGLCLLSASVIDGKIYVAGRCKDGDSGTKNSFEVFDTEAQFWDTLPSETQGGGLVFDGTTSIEGKFHVMTDQEAVAYDPKKGRWDLDLGGTLMAPCMIYYGYCEIDNVLYSASRGGVFLWYDTEVGIWRRLMGLVGVPKITAKSNVKLANYGGKMGVLWEGDVFSFGRWRRLKKKIWCAVIALERRNTSEIWGKLQWLDHVLTVPATSRVFVQVLRRELERVEKEKEEFISDFSEEDYNDIVGGWKSKLERSSSGEQKWGLFIANKK